MIVEYCEMFSSMKPAEAYQEDFETVVAMLAYDRRRGEYRERYHGIESTQNK